MRSISGTDPWLAPSRTTRGCVVVWNRRRTAAALLCSPTPRRRTTARAPATVPSSPGHARAPSALRLRLLNDLEALLGPSLHVAELRLGLALEGVEQLAPEVLHHAAIVIGRSGVGQPERLLDELDPRAVRGVERHAVLVQDLDGQLRPALLHVAAPLGRSAGHARRRGDHLL